MRKMTQEERKVPISVAFDQDILTKIEEVKGRISRSAWINIAVEKVLKMESKKARRAT